MEEKTISFVERRREICNSCDHLKKYVGVRMCGKCGCSIWGKTMIPFAKCPIGKWTEENAK
jgi:hypothetical protein